MRTVQLCCSHWMGGRACSQKWNKLLAGSPICPCSNLDGLMEIRANAEMVARAELVRGGNEERPSLQ